MVNRVNPPFDNPDIRKAMSLAIDRKPFNTILMEGQGLMGGAMLPKPVGEWGMPPEMVVALTGYGPDSREEHRRRPGDHAEARLQRRQAAADQDPDPQSADLSRSRRDRRPTSSRRSTSTANSISRYAAMVRAARSKDYTIGLNVTGVSVDDPDGNMVENYSCNSERNYTQYCNAEVDRLLSAQSRELDKEKRKQMVWDIEHILVDDAARPMHPARRRRSIAGSLT